MAYKKQTFIDNVTVLKAEHLEHIEDGICQLEADLEQARVDIVSEVLAALPSAEEVAF